MKVQMNVSIAGTRDGQRWPVRGEVVDLPDAEAQDMIDAGLASPVGAKVETAADAPAEAAEAPAQRGRTKKALTKADGV